MLFETLLGIGCFTAGYTVKGFVKTPSVQHKPDNEVEESVKPPLNLDDCHHNISNDVPWSSVSVCNNCYQVVGHNEKMTKLCLKCGFQTNTMGAFYEFVGIRRLRVNGHPIEQMKIGEWSIINRDKTTKKKLKWITKQEAERLSDNHSEDLPLDLSYPTNTLEGRL